MEIASYGLHCYFETRRRIHPCGAIPTRPAGIVAVGIATVAANSVPIVAIDEALSVDATQLSPETMLKWDTTPMPVELLASCRRQR